jgi:hypothetical protein
MTSDLLEIQETSMVWNLHFLYGGKESMVIERHLLNVVDGVARESPFPHLDFSTNILILDICLNLGIRIVKNI